MTQYLLKMHPGAKVAKIERCATEIALGLCTQSVPIVKPLTKQGLVSVEVLSENPSAVPFDKHLGALKCSDHNLPIILGETHFGEPLVEDLSTMPHLLIAGATGSGKSVMLHSIISSLEQQDNVQIGLIDPKTVEFDVYNNSDKLITDEVITSPGDALLLIQDLVDEMEERFVKLKKKKVSNIADYNSRVEKKMPYIVLVIDEFSDLMYTVKKEFEKHLGALAQKSRACGIHIVIATQRPSASVVTGVIKANFPARISCRVASYTDSKVILDYAGAEKLLGRGDALLKTDKHNMLRFQGAFIEKPYPEDDEIIDESKGFWSKLFG